MDIQYKMEHLCSDPSRAALLPFPNRNRNFNLKLGVYILYICINIHPDFRIEDCSFGSKKGSKAALEGAVPLCLASGQVLPIPSAYDLA